MCHGTGYLRQTGGLMAPEQGHLNLFYVFFLFPLPHNLYEQQFMEGQSLD